MTLSMELEYHCSNTKAVSPEVFNALSSQKTTTFPVLVPKKTLYKLQQSYTTVPPLARGKRDVLVPFLDGPTQQMVSFCIRPFR